MTALAETDRPNAMRWLLVVCVFAAVTQGGYLMLRPESSYSPDEKEYLRLAQGLAEHGGLRLPSGETAKRMPLYPALLSLIYRTQAPDLWQNAALVTQTFLAWCNTLMVSIIAWRLAGGRAGWIAGVTAALYAPFVFLQMTFLAETLLMFFTTAALLVYLFFCLQGRESRSRGFAPAGVSLLLGLAILTRPNALLLLIPFAVHAAVRSRPGCRAARAVLLLVPALCCAGVWGLRNQQRLGTFTLATVGGLNWYLGHNPDYAANPGLDRADYAAANRLRARHPEMNEAEIDRLLFQTGVDFIRRHPWQTIVDCFRKVGVWFTPRVPAYGPTVPLIAACALAAAGWREWRAGRMCARRLALQRAALAAILALAGLWMFQIIAFRRGRLDIAPLPFTTPLYVLSMGIPALLFLRTQFAVRGLFVGLIVSQLCVAVAFIPLSRLRWSIDPLLIIALAVGVDRLCHWLAAGGQPEESPPPPRTTMLE